MRNCQALCGSCNLRKGSSPQEIIEQYFAVDKLEAGTPNLRDWQHEALNVVIPRVLNEPVLVEACPGAGKTHFGLEVAYRFIKRGQVSRVLIFAPTIGISDGWLLSASAARPFSPTVPLVGQRTWRAVDPIGDDYVGAVATYHALFSASDMFLAHATDPGHRTLVIFDEVHHVGGDSPWGIAAQEAFAKTTAVLSLSGTPFRTKRDAIVFVQSEGGSATPHYRYGYDRAVVDETCRPVQFVMAKGTTTYRTEDGGIHTVSFDEDLTGLDQRRRLRTALECVGPRTIAALMLSEANEYLLRLRRSGDADAAGLAVCVDCAHADVVAAFMADHVCKQRPVVACSRRYDPSDPNPADAIRNFMTSHDPWLVAVNMVSEGIDIRRLRVVVYLTNRLTLLSFRQIVGRVVRTDPKNVDDHGRVYLPADPDLVEMATTITREVEMLPTPMTIVTDPTGRAVQSGEPGEKGACGEFEAIGSIGQHGGTLDTKGRSATAVAVEIARRYIAKKGLTNTDATSLALMMREKPELEAMIRKELEEDDQR